MTPSKANTLRSMTGYGHGTSSQGELVAEVEMRAVNGRHLGVKCRLPGDMLRLEPQVEGMVRKAVARGRVDVHCSVKTGKPRRRPRIDRDVLGIYRKELTALGGEPSAALLQLPGVVTLAEDGPSPKTVERLLLKAARDAVTSLNAARAAEGARLMQVLRRELAALERLASRVAKRVPGLVARHHRQLRERVGKLLDERLASDDAILRRELAVLADRGDVTEELDRLHSHLAALDDRLAARGPAGRELDFLLQEVGREVNTLGAKSADAVTARDVVQLKSAVERLREQAANIE